MIQIATARVASICVVVCSGGLFHPNAGTTGILQHRYYDDRRMTPRQQMKSAMTPLIPY